ncbi:PREDICTED: proline-rich protein 12-like [Rhinopithecus bieti]|uniref:proline-rich protein 12-like n=1 Tax=Rhinopithecus bieti TaxID=61621 RepID=UPI00083BF6FC|nr:PREDICTED: proline-rich protein 12-like [Rhinopithecus bieti]
MAFACPAPLLLQKPPETPRSATQPEPPGVPREAERPQNEEMEREPEKAPNSRTCSSQRITSSRTRQKPKRLGTLKSLEE